MMQLFSRRSFLFTSAAAAAAAHCRAEGTAETDPSLSVFFSDIHVASKGVKTKWGAQPDYQNPLLDRAIDQVLAMRPRPKRVVVFGDVALWFGHAADYAEAAPRLKRLAEAGIDLYVTTGNHDHRKPMFAAFPLQQTRTPVSGRVTSLVNLGSADLLLLDSLNENPDGEGSNNAVAGILDAPQAEWLLATAKAATRPFFVGAHHPPRELAVKGKPLIAMLEDNPHFAGFIHGHNHTWQTSWVHTGYSRPHVVRVACLPSTGWWGTIGFATFRTSADKAVLSLAPGNDFFFPKPLAAGAHRPPEWDAIVAEERGATCTFPYGR